MSINSCSINEYTINTLCGRRRRAIIDSLLPQVPSTGGGQQQHVHADTRVPLNIFRRDNSEERVVDITTLELPYVQVTIEFNGDVRAQTLDRVNTYPMITVYSLSFSENEVEPTINISDLKFRTI